MPDALYRALASLKKALDEEDPEAVCKASRVVYALAIEAALTHDGRWASRRRLVEKLFLRALDSPALRECSEKGYLRNVEMRYRELSPLLQTASPAALSLATLAR